MAGFATSEGRVHVITGALKASMHPSSSLGAGDWEGTMSAARYPGIFELARGNRPTKYHPARRPLLPRSVARTSKEK